MYDFLVDLDGYFCEKYANYDKLCVLPGYRMPTMQATRVDEFGRSFSYTLPSSNMRLALQENKEEILAELKKRIVDKGFSFSFYPIGGFKRFKRKFAKITPAKILLETMAKYKLTSESVLEELVIDKEIWENICKGKFGATKNTIISLALIGHFSVEDTTNLFYAFGYDWDFAVERDVVFAYLLENKVFARPMMNAAFEEYKVANLFLK